VSEGSVLLANQSGRYNYPIESSGFQSLSVLGYEFRRIAVNQCVAAQ